MIEVFACRMAWAQQGGRCMIPLPSSDQEQSALVHIWTHLSSDLQIRVIGLLAQLALNAVVVRPVSQCEREEACHDEPAADPQNPS
ncbi:MAG TPA: hypothetical protein VIY29_30045 [Ktedonobacteraceae bacterium]